MPMENRTPPNRIRLQVWSSGMPDTVFHWFTWTFAAVVLGLCALIGVTLWQHSALARTQFGLGFLYSSVWDPVQEVFGALPFVYGTLVSSALALLLATPLSLGAALFLAEVSPQWLQTPVSFLIELLAAIPSVICGLWGIFVLVPHVQALEMWLGEHVGWVPLFAGAPYGIGMLAGGVILAVMITPIITTLTREVLQSVPGGIREASYALGATKWETLRRAVLPSARAGILGAVLLGLARALGETMAVTMVIGNRPEISVSLFAPSYTLASVLANEFTEATADLYLSALVEIGLLLFGVTILVNAIARLLIGKVSGGSVTERRG